jgi:hypothetical protein
LISKPCEFAGDVRLSPVKRVAAAVAWLRREVFADGEISREAADEVFAVETVISGQEQYDPS